MRVRLAAALIVVGVTSGACPRWRMEVAPVRPLPVASGEPGECEPGEYVLAGAGAWDVDLRLIIDDQGHTLSVSVLHGHDPRSDELAQDVARHVFACTRPLAPQASRVIPSWLVHFRPLDPPHPIDLDACRRRLRYPRAARDKALEGSVRLVVATDPTGAVLRAWTHQADTLGLVDAAVENTEKCRFTAAFADGKPVATAFHHDVDFVLPR